MNIYIALFRGINVGGHRKIKMNELITLFESLNYNNIKTYLQSGNVVFRAMPDDFNKINMQIRDRFRQIYGYEIQIIIRNSVEFIRILQNNPFSEQLRSDQDKLFITFLSGIPDETKIRELHKYKKEKEEFIILGSEVYLYCPDGYGKTKLTNNLFEKKLELTATTRNWNTVNKIYDLIKSV